MKLVGGLFGFLVLGRCTNHTAFCGIEAHEPIFLPSFEGLQVHLQNFTVLRHPVYPVEQAVVGEEANVRVCIFRHVVDICQEKLGAKNCALWNTKKCYQD